MRLERGISERNAGARGCTTTRQNAHSSELEIVYPWHPWFGRTVTIKRAVKRRARAVLHAVCEDDGRIRLLEVPQWMLDRAACSVMRSSDQPQVSCEHLRLLQNLLACTGMEELRGDGPRAEGDVIEEQHLDSSSKGDADAQEPSAPSRRSTRSVSAGARKAHLADAAARSNTAGQTATGPTPARASRRASRSSERKGGHR